MAKNKEAAVATSKSKCPITREQFQAGAKAMTVSIGNRQVIASPKEFGTGSFGWYAGDKIVIEIDGTPVKVQVGMNLTVVGSKEANDE